MPPGLSDLVIATRSMQPSIVHITAREGLSSAFMPQVVRPMSLVRARGYDVALAVLAPLGELLRRDLRTRWRSRRREVAEGFGLSLALLPSAPSRARGWWSDSAMLRLWLARRTGPLILHCRGTEATHLALDARGRRRDVRVVTDCRGIEAPEQLMYRGIADLAVAPMPVQEDYLRRDALQCEAIRRADAALCVSNAMRGELASRWSIETARMRTVPCCTDAEAGRRAAARREETRARLGLGGKLVVGYSGSAAPWQVLPEVLATFRQVADLHGNAHLLVLTTDRGHLEAAVRTAGIPAANVSILSVPHREVPDHLAAADLGLLLREDSIVNRVASPMKFAEYIACGVPVVLTEGIGDFSEMVRRERIGAIVPRLGQHPDNVVSLRDLLQMLQVEGAAVRARCHSAADREMAWGSAVDAILATYADLVALQPVGSARPADASSRQATTP